MKLFKKIILVLALVLGVAVLTACSCKEEKKFSEEKITVYTRDTTSGTRDGFFTGIGFKEAATDNAPLVAGFVEVTDNGDMIAKIQNDEYGIGYISLASYADSGLKGLKYEGVEPTEANVLNESYELTRNFNYVVRNDYAVDSKEGKLVAAFVAYMFSKEGKEIIKSKDGILEIKASDPKWSDLKAAHPVVNEDNSSVTLRLGGSTSVQKIAEALSAAFKKEAGCKVSHNHTGSGAAYKATQGSEKDGATGLDIGFASREFKADSEPAAAGSYGKLCVDAIVAVVHKDNKQITGALASQLKKVYNGTYKVWGDLKDEQPAEKPEESVSGNIIQAVNGYFNRDTNVIINDDLIDQLEKVIQEQCVDLMVSFTPLARDLRVILGILKLITDLERIGDHAEDIAIFSNALNKHEYKQLDQVKEMADISTNMIRLAIDAFVKDDLELAEKVIKQDDKIDKLYFTLLKQLMETKNLSNEVIVYHTLILRYLERTADHAVNVAEWVIYIISGYHKSNPDGRFTYV